MSDYRITAIYNQDAHMCVAVEHYHPDGSFWFSENYRWQGREGSKRKRATDAEGFLLLDDGQRAPERSAAAGETEQEQYLPSGRDWQYRPGLHMDESSLLAAIQSTHDQRRNDGFPQGQIDIIQRLPDDKIDQKDKDGCDALVAHFASLVRD